ncbi:MAG: hypothetical protein GYA29_00685 [Methanothrix sp.]|nr:hypothetical protein [Methanothrix sp.]
MNLDYHPDGPNLSNLSVPKEDNEWWENGSEGHRFAGEVLQLRIRREIMKFIGPGIMTREEIKKAFSLDESLAELQLALLEKAMMIEKVIDCEGYRSTPVGIAYLKNFEDFAHNY